MIYVKSDAADYVFEADNWEIDSKEVLFIINDGTKIAVFSEWTIVSKENYNETTEEL